MDTNLIIALVGAPLLFAVIAWIVVYSRRQHQKNIRQTSIKPREARVEITRDTSVLLGRERVRRG